MVIVSQEQNVKIVMYGTFKKFVRNASVVRNFVKTHVCDEGEVSNRKDLFGSISCQALICYTL